MKQRLRDSFSTRPAEGDEVVNIMAQASGRSREQELAILLRLLKSADQAYIPLSILLMPLDLRRPRPAQINAIVCSSLLQDKSISVPFTVYLEEKLSTGLADPQRGISSPQALQQVMENPRDFADFYAEAAGLQRDEALAFLVNVVDVIHDRKIREDTLYQAGTSSAMYAAVGLFSNSQPLLALQGGLVFSLAGKIDLPQRYAEEVGRMADAVSKFANGANIPKGPTGVQ